MYEEINDLEICVICLEYVENDLEIAKNICSHCKFIAHKKCVSKWFIEKKQTICPICREYVENNNENLEEDINYINYNLIKLLLILLCIIIGYYLYSTN